MQDQQIANVTACTSRNSHTFNTATQLIERLSPSLKRSMEIASEKGASSWLTALPITEHGFALHKGAFRDIDTTGNQPNSLRAAVVATLLPSITSYFFDPNTPTYRKLQLPSAYRKHDNFNMSRGFMKLSLAVSHPSFSLHLAACPGLLQWPSKGLGLCWQASVTNPTALSSLGYVATSVFHCFSLP